MTTLVYCTRCGRENSAGSGFCTECGASLAGEAKPRPLSGSPVPPVAESDLADKYAGLRRRLVALIIDSVVIIGLGLGLSSAAFVILNQRVDETDLGEYALAAVGFALLIIMAVAALYLSLLVGFKGQTLGKMVVGIRVVDKEGKIPGLRRAFVRELVGKLLIGTVLVTAVSALTGPLSLLMVPGAGLTWIARSRAKQGWHDQVANTYVIKRTPRSPVPGSIC